MAVAITSMYRIDRNRLSRLLAEEKRLAENLRGINQYGWRLLDDRNTLDFDIEYFMTFHINGMKYTDKMWCDGAEVLKRKNVGLNKYLLEGNLWLMPEDESNTPKAYESFDKTWCSTLAFKGYVLLKSGVCEIKYYDFRITGQGVNVRCRRKI
ncbi:hypothetical protein [Halioxenophilus aromaticivorans]|uniref:Uncharacterized protein n=1 Tax=Halioxenophilus aromaticivorans TaxID=1306992 RepID=A0AAV3U1M2_9ALTE